MGKPTEDLEFYKIWIERENKTIIFKEDDDDITISSNAAINDAMSSPKLESIGIAFLGIRRTESHCYIEFLTLGYEAYTMYELETKIVKLLDEKYISEDIARVADIPIVDETLSINGAAAESIAVSNKFDELDEAINDRFNSLTWSDLGDKQQQELVFEVENMERS